jgi:hypothetical protein
MPVLRGLHAVPPAVKWSASLSAGNTMSPEKTALTHWHPLIEAAGIVDR